MKLEYLAYITAIHQGGSLSKAAVLLHTTPQNVSRVLQLLENETQLTLFNRTTQGIVLTEAGEDALLFASATLDDYQKLLEKHQQNASVQNSLKGTLNIVTFPAAGLIFLNKLVLDFYQAYPNIVVTNLEMDLENSFQYFLAHDDVVATLPIKHLSSFAKYQDQLEWIPIASSKIAVIASKNSHLAQKPSITLKQFCKEHLTIISKSSYQKSATYTLLSLYHLENSLKYKPFTTSNIDLHYQAIIHNNCVGLINETSFFHINSLYQKQLTLIPIRDLSDKIHYSIVRHKKNHLSKAGQAFYHFCETYTI